MIFAGAGIFGAFRAFILGGFGTAGTFVPFWMKFGVAFVDGGRCPAMAFKFLGGEWEIAPALTGGNMLTAFEDARAAVRPVLPKAQIYRARVFVLGFVHAVRVS